MKAIKTELQIDDTRSGMASNQQTWIATKQTLTIAFIGMRCYSMCGEQMIFFNLFLTV